MMSNLRPGKYVRLEGVASEIERWGKVAASLNAEVCRRGNEFYLACPVIDATGTPDAACTAAIGIVDRVNNAYLLANSSVLHVGVDSAATVDPAGRLTVYVSLSASAHGTAQTNAALSGVDGQLLPTIEPDVDNAREIVEAMSLDDGVAHVVRYISTPDADYVDLYKALEIMEDDPHGHPVKLGYITKNGLDRLTQNLNHQGLSGDDARHARMAGSPSTSKKLSPDEVRRQVKELARKWIKGKLGR